MFGRSVKSVSCTNSIALIENLEPRTLLSADLVASTDFRSGYFGNGLVAGDKGYINLTLTNEGDMTARGSIRSNFYLSTDQVLDNSDILVAGNVRTSINIRAGRSATYKALITVPQLDHDQQYYVIADANTTGTVIEEDSDNNVAASPLPMDVTYIFGWYHGRRLSLTLTDSSSGQDVAVTFTSKGYGYGLIAGDSTPDAPGYDLTIKACDSGTGIYVTPQEGQTTSINYLAVYGNIGKISAIHADLTGDMYVSGTMSTLILGDVGLLGGDNITMRFDASSTKWLDMDLGKVANTSIISDQSIGDLIVTEWIDDSGDKDTIDAPTIDYLRAAGGDGTAGDFQSDVNVTQDSRHHNPYIGMIDIEGTVSDSTIRADGDIDDIYVGASFRSNFLAGVDDGKTQPDDTDDYSEFNFWGNVDTHIRNFVVRGLEDDPDGTFFADSNVAAGSIDTAYLKNIQYDNGGQDMGIFVAHHNDWGDPVHRLTQRDTLGDWTDTDCDLHHDYRDLDFVVRVV